MVRLTLEEYEHNRNAAQELNKAIKKPERPRGGLLLESIKVLIVTLAIVLPVRFFLFQPFFVEGASMEPNFQQFQYLIIDEITYRFSAPQRGDVVVLRVPFEKEALIKRVIGLPGETIKIHNSQITVYNAQSPSGFVLNEVYLGKDITTNQEQQTTLGDDQFFVMGDNRPVSLDSRYFGPITKNQIVGRAWLRVWPFNTFQHFVPPIY